MVTRKSSTFARKDDDEMSMHQARAYAKELQQYFRSARVEARSIAQGLAYVDVVYEWSSGLPNFTLKTVREVEEVLAEERRSQPF